MFNEYYSEKETQQLFQLSKYRVRQLGLTSTTLGGNGLTVYKADEVIQIAKDMSLYDEDFQTRQRKIDAVRRDRKFSLNDYVSIHDILNIVPLTRQRIDQLRQSTSRPIRIKIWGKWFYDKSFFKQRMLNEGNLAKVKLEESYKKLDFNTFEDWLEAVREW